MTDNPIGDDGRDIYKLAQSRGYAVLDTSSAAKTEVDNNFNAPADSNSLRSLTLSTSRTTTNSQTAVGQLPENLKRRDANTEIFDFQAVELGNHQREVWYVRFSNDARQLVTCGEFHRVVIWDLASRTALFTLKGHKDSVTCATWSPDDSMLVTTSKDGEARVWDADVSG